MSKAKAVEAAVTITVAKEWAKTREQTIFFDDLMDRADIDVSLTNRPNEFDRLQVVFEDRCEVVLKNASHPFKVNCTNEHENETMTNLSFNQIEVISKLYYGTEYRTNSGMPKMSYEDRVKMMLRSDFGKYKSCLEKSNELGYHKDFDKYTDFMGS